MLLAEMRAMRPSLGGPASAAERGTSGGRRVKPMETKASLSAEAERSPCPHGAGGAYTEDLPSRPVRQTEQPS